MTNEFNATPAAPNFNAALTGANENRKDTGGSLIGRRTLRRGRRANRAI